MENLFQKPFFWVVGVAIVVAILAIFSLVETVPPDDLTVTRMVITEARLRSFWKNAGRLPDKLSDLPKLDARDNSTTDGWGREIEYKIEGTIVVLLSRGRGRPIERGVNQDISYSFDVSKSGRGQPLTPNGGR